MATPSPSLTYVTLTRTGALDRPIDVCRRLMDATGSLKIAHLIITNLAAYGTARATVSTESAETLAADLAPMNVAVTFLHTDA